MTLHRFSASIGFLLLLAFCWSVPVYGQSLPDGFSARDDGSIQVNDLLMRPLHYDRKWHKARYKVDPSFTNAANITGAIWNFDSQLLTGAGPLINLHNQIQNQSDGMSIRWLISAHAQQPVDSYVLAMDVMLPAQTYAGRTIGIDDKQVTLPLDSGKGANFTGKLVKRIQIATAQGPVMLAGQFMVDIADNRRYSINTFSLRLYFAPGQYKITDANLDLTITRQTFACQAVNLAPVCNMGFKDDADGDQRGGWSDQGAANDLRNMKPETKNFNGVVMQIIDPAKNAGKSCLMLCGEARPYFPHSAQVDAPKGTFKTLWLLHALAWAPKTELAKTIGTVKATYADGSVQDIPVTSNVDVADWWGASNRSNGSVMWSAPNGVNYVGLFLSRFQLQDKPLQSLTLTSTGISVWGIVAATVCRDAPPLPRPMQMPTTIHEDDNWRPLQQASDVLPDSALDMSFLTEPGPAGKHGRIVIRQGYLEFAKRPGVPVRLMGTNVVFHANFLPAQEARTLALTLRRMGYNYVRLHHFGKLLCDPDGKHSDDFDPGQLDRLDYFLSCLKAQGIYVTTDLYTNRYFKADESSLGTAFSYEIKTLFPVDPIARKTLKKWADKLLTHVNPYTGLSLADDPMFATLSLMNEEFLLQRWSLDPRIKAMYMQRYTHWLKANKLHADPQDESSPLLTRFLYENSSQVHQLMIQQLRRDGIDPLFTADNADRIQASALMRQPLDFVDNHFYHDHPAYGIKRWSLPYVFSTASALRQQAGSLRQMFPTRLWDKPFSISEFNFCAPNPYRAESGPLVGAYAALQDWNMLCRFDWAGEKQSDVISSGPVMKFDVNNDPINRMADRIIGMLFTRGDVWTADKRVAYLVTPQSVYRAGAHRSEAPIGFSELGLISGVGVLTDQSIKGISSSEYAAVVGPDDVADAVPAGVKFISTQGDLRQNLLASDVVKPSQWDQEHGRFVSDTGQITMAAGLGTMVVDTPKSQALVLAEPGSLHASNLAVEHCTTHATLFLGSLDDKPLAESGRMVLMHLSDVLNSKMKFDDAHHRTLTDWGTLPLLVKKSTATVTLKIDQPQQMMVFAVDLSGKRIGKVTSQVHDGKLVFTVDTAGQPCGVLAYELTRFQMPQKTGN